MMQNRKLAREMKASRMGTKQEADGGIRGENRGGREGGIYGLGALPSDDRGQSRPSYLKGLLLFRN